MGLREAMIGIAIGDAFGTGIEFQDRRWIHENVSVWQFVNARTGKHAKNYEPGFYSDDTEHSIGVLKAMMDPRGFSSETLLDCFKAEYESDKKEKGFPRQGHGSIVDWYEGRKTIEEVRASQAQRENPGNGPAMRAVPIGFADPSCIDRYAIINADATHPHPKARAASILIARAAQFMVVESGEPWNVISHCAQFIDEEETLSLLREADRLPSYILPKSYETLCGPQPIPYFLSRGKELYGVPCDAMRTAVASLYIIKNADHADEGLRQAVGLGGDVDSVAAICTGVLAGRWGLESLPKFLLEQTEGVKKLEKLADEFMAYQKKID